MFGQVVTMQREISFSSLLGLKELISVLRLNKPTDYSTPVIKIVLHLLCTFRQHQETSGYFPPMTFLSLAPQKHY